MSKLKYLRRGSRAWKNARAAIVGVQKYYGEEKSADQLRATIDNRDLECRMAYDPDGLLYVQTPRAGYTCELSNNGEGAA